MTDFEVIYTNWLTDKTIRSKVYAVEPKHFLIVDENGKFIWAFIDDCRLDVICPDELNTDAEPAWDSYDRIVTEGL